MSQQERKVKTCKLFRAQENTGDKAMHGLSFKVDFLDQLLSVVEKKKSDLELLYTLNRKCSMRRT